LGWVLVIPVLSLVIAFLGTHFPIPGFLLAFCSVGVIRAGLHGLYGPTEPGPLFFLLALASATAVAISSMLLPESYVSMFGDRVDAVVVARGNAGQIADPVTNEDLGVVGGISRGIYYEVGDTVPVVVSRRFVVRVVRVDEADFGVTIAKIWLSGWLLGLALTVVTVIGQRRESQLPPAG
jgi:hypothetical protein